MDNTKSKQYSEAELAYEEEMRKRDLIMEKLEGYFGVPPEDVGLDDADEVFILTDEQVEKILDA